MNSRVKWELGYDKDDDFGGPFDQNREDLDAINEYFGDTSRKVEATRAAGKLDTKRYNEWHKLKKDWMLFYQKVIASWYTSDEDIAFARQKRDVVNMLLSPKAMKHLQKTTVTKKPALTPKEFKQWQEEDLSFFAKNWKLIAGGVATSVAAAWIILPRVVASTIIATNKSRR